MSVPSETSFQARVVRWCRMAFGQKDAKDHAMRIRRFVEESAELAQACGMSEDEMHLLVTYVYRRPVGVVHDEIGGVMITLATVCDVWNCDLDYHSEMALERCWVNIAAIRARHAQKVKEIG